MTGPFGNTCCSHGHAYALDGEVELEIVRLQRFQGISVNRWDQERPARLRGMW